LAQERKVDIDCIHSPELYTEGYPYFVRGRDRLRTHVYTLFQSQIIFYDGAMGTMIRNYAKRNMLEEEELRGDMFINWTCNVKGNNDIYTSSAIGTTNQSRSYRVVVLSALYGNDF
jgi:hypothetical protein